MIMLLLTTIDIIPMTTMTTMTSMHEKVRPDHEHDKYYPYHC